MAKLSNDINSEFRASHNHENEFPDQLPREQITEFWKPKARLSTQESSEPVKSGRSSQHPNLSKNQLAEPDSMKVKLIKQETQAKELSSSGFMALKKNSYRKERNDYEPVPHISSPSGPNVSRPSVNVDVGSTGVPDEIHIEKTKPKPERRPHLEQRPKAKRIPMARPEPKQMPMAEPELRLEPPRSNPKPESKPRSKPKPEPESKPRPKPEHIHRPETKQKREPIPEPAITLEPNRKPTPELELTPNRKRKRKSIPKPELTPEHELKPKPDLAPEPNLKQKPKPNRKSKQKFKPKRTPIRVIANLLFYISLLFIMFILVLGFHNTNRPIIIFGYTIQNVFTDCLESTVPKDSLIIVQRVNSNELESGDIITFYLDQQTVLTQLITEVHDDAYAVTGTLAFETSGLGITHDILIPDANVMGQVIFIYPDLGALLIEIPNMVLNPDYFFPVLGAYVGIMVLVFLLRGLFSKGKIKKNRKKTASKDKRHAQMS